MRIHKHFSILALAVFMTVGLGCSSSTSTSEEAPDGETTGVDAPEDVQDASEDTSEDVLDASEDAAKDSVDDVAQDVVSDALDADADADVEVEESHAELYEHARFHLMQPVRIWAVKGVFYIPVATTLEVHVWDDFGGNFINFQHVGPLATASMEVTPEDSGTWLTIPLDAPIDVDPGRLVYAGVILDAGIAAPATGVLAPEGVEKGITEWSGVDDGAWTGYHQYNDKPDLVGFPQLYVDDAVSVPEGDLPGHSLIWSPNDPPNADGFPPVSLAAGDYLIQLETELIHGVDEFAFEPISVEEMGLPSFSRIALEDVNGDGAIDAMTGAGLYLNDGTGHFTNASGEWLPNGTPANGMFGDYDNDGDPDFFSTGGKDTLWRNDGGVFVDVTAESGIDDWQLFTCNGNKADQNVPTETASWIDANGDGWLDLYQGNFICWDDAFGAKDLLWINQGDGTFVESTEAANMVEGQLKMPGEEKYYYLASRGTAPADYDGDGDMDLHVTNYRLHRNLMWANQGDGTFVNRGVESILEGYATDVGFQTHYGHTIGAVWGDVDHDGDLDVFHANLAHPRFFDFSDLATLYINGGGSNPVFTDVGAEIGIRYQETPSNPNFIDYDNDGDLDLFYTCVYAARPSQFYRNDGHPAWKEVSYPTGVAVLNGWGSVVADIDQDGDLDLLAGNQRYRNRNLSGGGSILVRPRGGGAGMTNRSGFGARASATVDGKLIVRELTGSHGTSVQESPFLHIGLGSVPTATVDVFFPGSGQTVTVPDVGAGSRLVVDEDGTVTFLLGGD